MRRLSGRTHLSKNVRLLCVLVLLLFATENEARAYTDPGSGFLIWQFMVATFFGVLYYSRRVLAWFKSKKGPRA